MGFRLLLFFAYCNKKNYREFDNWKIGKLLFIVKIKQICHFVWENQANFLICGIGDFFVLKIKLK